MEKELFDCIKPGEFTFCSRCGHICRIGAKDFMCTSCKAGLFSRKESQQEHKERLLKEKVQQQISEIIIKYREDLAKLRKRGKK